MSCSDFEHLIAMYVEEDLSAVEHSRVEVHLKKCSNCWDLAEDLKESQAAFKSIRQDVPDATALSALRERVLSEVSGVESMTWFERFLFGGLRRKAALACIALVLVGSSAMWLARSPRVVPEKVTVAAVEPLPPVVVPAPIPEAEPSSAPVRPTRKRAPRPAPAVEETKQVAIQFVTDDPNVIIYWLVDAKGD
jgi:anti-sigma factor RsiW